jgi:hypothetical protein
MWTRRDTTASTPETTENNWRLDHWRFVGSADGLLRIRPVGPTLSCSELEDILGRLREEETGLAEVVFDFQTIRSVEGPWTLMIALLIDFARRTNARCVITRLDGQLASVVALYRLRHVVGALFDRQESPTSSGIAAAG